MRCYEFRDLNKKQRKRQGITLQGQSYLDYLRESDYSPRAKKFYEKVYQNNGGFKFRNMLVLQREAEKV